MTVLGCIADDFTGACDLASLLKRSGAEVSVRIGVPKTPARHTQAVEIIALKCRSTAPDEARMVALNALKWLQQAGAERFYFKYCSTFDSTPQGNIGVIGETLMYALGANQTIYCPSYPAYARTVYKGHMFVGDQLLSDSPMKDHPLNPMKNSNLEHVLAPQLTKGTTGLISHIDITQGAEQVQSKLADLQNQGKQHIITDTLYDVDLYTIAKACKHMVLLTGGSAIAYPLSKVYQDMGVLSAYKQRADIPQVGGGKIVLSGSCSAMTQAQVAEYIKTAVSYRLDPLKIATDGTQDIKNWLSHQDIYADKIIYATADSHTVAKVYAKLGKQGAKIVEKTMAELAMYAFDLGIRQFTIAGGETSGAVTTALGVQHLQVEQEIAPAVPWTFCTCKNTPIALALKSGNFGGIDFFDKSFIVLQHILNAP